MKIAVVGLGLIGGSFCKAIKTKTQNECFGIDKNSETIKKALECNAIDGEIVPSSLKEMDLTIVCLHPPQTISFINENIENFNENGIIIDACGVKRAIIEGIDFKGRPLTFIGAHPMAGREFSGFDYSLPTLFENASFIMTPSQETPTDKLDLVRSFALSLGFSKVVISTPTEHDRIIAFSSQLAHVVSSAYIKSSSLQKIQDFSAGSYLDLTRVARLNEDMWTSLFMMNKEPLLFEINTLIEKLSEYKKTLEDDDSEELRKLLREGRILKEESMF